MKLIVRSRSMLMRLVCDTPGRRLAFISFSCASLRKSTHSTARQTTDLRGWRLGVAAGRLGGKRKMRRMPSNQLNSHMSSKQSRRSSAMRVKFTQLFCALPIIAGWVLTSAEASAQDSLKLAIGQRGNWDTSFSEVGTRAGIYKKHGLTLEMLYTQGSAETLQAVLSNSVDIGVAAGIMGVLGAYSKKAPVRILGAEATGAGDLFWYVKADSPIKTLKDTDGKTIAFSGKGSSTDGIVTAFMKQYDLKAKPTATGGPPQ